MRFTAVFAFTRSFHCRRRRRRRAGIGGQRRSVVTRIIEESTGNRRLLLLLFEEMLPTEDRFFFQSEFVSGMEMLMASDTGKAVQVEDQVFGAQNHFVLPNVQMATRAETRTEASSKARVMEMEISGVVHSLDVVVFAEDLSMSSETCSFLFEGQPTIKAFQTRQMPTTIDRHQIITLVDQRSTTITHRQGGAVLQSRHRSTTSRHFTEQLAEETNSRFSPDVSHSSFKREREDASPYSLSLSLSNIEFSSAKHTIIPR